MNFGEKGSEFIALMRQGSRAEKNARITRFETTNYFEVRAQVKQDQNTKPTNHLSMPISIIENKMIKKELKMQFIIIP